MRHLFVINPTATLVKGKVRELTDEVDSFFRGKGLDNYDVYVTEWARDGMGYMNDYALVNHGETVRIHLLGGSGMIYEAINGTIGLPNIEIAAYPMGGSRMFLHYFGLENLHLFRSIEEQVNSGTTPIDAIRYENFYGVGFVMIGLEAISARVGMEMIERTGLPVDLCHKYCGVNTILRVSQICQRYEIDIDGKDFSGEYASMLVAGCPSYGRDMMPAPEAHPNDGFLDFYFVKKASALRILRVMPAYLSGDYKKFGDTIMHVRGKRISISSERDICMCFDGENYHERSATFDVVPAAFKFVCPDAIDIAKIPRVLSKNRGYGK